MRLFHGLVVAEAVMGILRPYCDRIEVAGSIRRKKPEVGDVEICCIPKPAEILDFIQAANSLGEIVKGDAGGKYLCTMFKTPTDMVQIDLFMLKPENWGWLFLIRTGSAEFSHSMACKLNDHGLTSRKGMVCSRRSKKPIVVREETDLFKLVGMGYIEPENRV